MKGSVGTSTRLVYIKDKRKRFKHKKGYIVCNRCKQRVKKGEWITHTAFGAYRHSYRCPNTSTPKASGEAGTEKE